MFAIEGLQPGDFLYDGTAVSFRADFKSLLETLGLADKEYRPYSLRRGGATAAFRGGMPWQAVAEIGRWAFLSTLRIYVTEDLAVLQKIRTPEATWKILTRESTELHELLRN